MNFSNDFFPIPIFCLKLLKYLCFLTNFISYKAKIAVACIIQSKMAPRGMSVRVT